jgi:MFS family permease
LLLARGVLPARANRRTPGRAGPARGGAGHRSHHAMVYAVIQVEHAGPASMGVLAPLALGAAALAAFIAVERRTPAPLLRLGLLRVRSLVGACVGVATTSLIYSAVVFVGSLYLQRVRGYDATAAGLAFLPVTLAGGLVSLVGARLVRRLGNRLVAVASLLLGAATLAAFAVAAATGAPYPMLILPALLVQSVATYGSWVALVGLAARDVEGPERGVASSVFEASIHVGGAFAVAVLATALATVAHGPEDAAGYTAAYLAGVLMVVVGTTVVAVLLRPRSARPPNIAAPHETDV